jgi:uncharacterized protein YidB (DUF937 family)
MKKLLATATAVGLLTLGAGGTAFAQSDGGSGSSTSTTAPAADSSKAGQTPGAGRGARRHVRREALKVAAQAAADAIGVTTDELKTAVKGGQSVAELAQSKGVSVDDVKSAISKALSDRIDKAVADGKITADQAAKVKGNLSTRIDKLVNRHRGDRAKANAPTTPAS